MRGGLGHARVRGEMGGGWVGYLYAMLGCGSLFGVLLVSTLILYAVARIRERKNPPKRIRVSTVSARGDRS